MKRRIDIRIGDRRALGGGGGSETLGDGGGPKAVVLLRLIGESKESEEAERAKDGSPSIELKRNDGSHILLKHHRRELEDTGIPPVGISPGDPWTNLGQTGVRDNRPDGKWESEDEIDGSQNDETPVAVVSKRAIGRDEILELLSPLYERTDSEDWTEDTN